jgi:REP element-mobilizing transposase RayT
MPNHVHALLEPSAGHELSKIVHSWKSFTATRCNKQLQRSGEFWQKDIYNHIIRSQKEYEFQRHYVWRNPEKAGLEDWEWRWMKKPLVEPWEGVP